MINIEELKNRLIKANEAYRAGSPTITDQEFDDLCDEVQNLVSHEEWAALRSSFFEKAGKIVHPWKMGSLQKFKYEEPQNLCEWINNHISTALNISAKVDGISLRLRFEDGKLISGTTRGDGTKGENVTDKIFKVKNVPHTINIPGTIDIRGELVMFVDDFEKYADKYANSRNFTAGLFGRKELSPELADVSFVAYTIFGNEFTKKEQFKLLEENGFYTAWHKSIDISELQNKTAIGFDKFNNELRDYVKQVLPYGTDGLVLSDDEYRNENVLIPENQIAFKVNESIAETTVIGIEWRGPSKDGKFVPVIQLDPVEIAQTIVSQCSGYNIDYIVNNDIRPGMKCKIVKSGEIIPKLVEVDGRKCF